MSGAKTMTKWEVGQELIKIADLMSEVETDFKKEGRSEFAFKIRPMRMQIGKMFNDLESHVFQLPDFVESPDKKTEG